MDPTHTPYIYTLFENFRNNTVGALWNWKENITLNINALSKKCFFNTFFENPVLYTLTNYDTAWVCHCWKNGWYFYKMRLATLAAKYVNLLNWWFSAVFFVPCQFCISLFRGFGSHKRCFSFHYHDVNKGVMKKIFKSLIITIVVKEREKSRF